MANIKDSKAPIKFKLTIGQAALRKKLTTALREFEGRKNTKALRDEIGLKVEEIVSKYLVVEKETKKTNAKK